VFYRTLTLTVLSAAALTMAACSRAENTTADPASEPEVATDMAAAPADAVEVSQVQSSEAACRQAVQAQFGQEGPAVTFINGEISWRAPVDGGRLSFACTVDGSQVSLTREGETQVVTLNTTAAAPAQQEAH